MYSGGINLGGGLASIDEVGSSLAIHFVVAYHLNLCLSNPQLVTAPAGPHSALQCEGGVEAVP